MKLKKWGIALLIVAIVLAVSGGLVTCAMAFSPSPVNSSVTVEAGAAEIPMDRFPVENKAVTLITDISNIDLQKPGT